MSQASVNQVPVSQSIYSTQDIKVDDEIDLSALFNNLWKKRLVVLLSALLFGLMGAAYFFTAWFNQPTINTASLEVRFNFPEIQNGTYPNGQTFSLNDLLAPPILSLVYKQHQLQKYSISQSDFTKAIQITPYASNREFIEKKFKDALASKDLSAAEIDEINENYTKALAAANLRFAKITLTFDSKLAIPQDIMLKILASLPPTWASESIESYGVLDIASANIGPLDKGLLNNYEYMVAAQYLEDYLAYVEKSALNLQKDEVGRLIIDPDTQLNIDDVIEEINNLREFNVSVLQRSFAVAPVVRDKEEAVFYLQNQIIVNEETLQQLNRQAAVVDQAYKQLLGVNQPTPSLSSSSNSERLGYPTQYGDEFLTRLMSIGDELSESKFKQSLLDREV